MTLNGAALPDETMDRGALLFALREGAMILGRPFGTAGVVIYAVTLLPGDYVVMHQANRTLCNRLGRGRRCPV